MEYNIVKFRPKAKPTRNQAKQWLKQNIDSFPTDIPGYVGPDLFYGWRFILATDGVVYFANCLESGITEEELLNINNG